MSLLNAKLARMLKSSPSLVSGAVIAILSVSVARTQTQTVTATKDFVVTAAQSDEFETVEGRTALAQTHDPRVQAFAQQTIQAHTRTRQALRSAAARAGMNVLPTGLNGDQQKWLSSLQSQRGSEFDSTYLKQQVLAHREALVVEQAYVTQGANADVRQAAQSAVPLTQRYLDMAQQLRSALGGSQ